jgi:LPPG:FO 2-phospho-L-lactate transferase
MTVSRSGPVLALCGGVGGTKLALGLYRVLASGGLTVAVNTGDDFEHLGLHISPDLDTVLYTLGGLADPERGWGRADETWHFMESISQAGGETWFRLGDRDVAVHVLRTAWIRSGRTLSAFAAYAAERFGITAAIVPMSDAPVRTMIDTEEGELPFQHYFVRRKAEPRVRAIRFAHAEQATPSDGLLNLMTDSALKAIIICPSNPYLSVDPILAVPGIAAALTTAAAPVVAVSPIIGGKAVKGPTAKIMAELGIATTPQAIASHYRGLISGLVVDESDAEAGRALDLPVLGTRTLMCDVVDKERLAGEVLAFADTLAWQPATTRAGGASR